ncbi:hypothetical protein FRX31_014091, partial [Thalictrum thalictroides]
VKYELPNYVLSDPTNLIEGIQLNKMDKDESQSSRKGKKNFMWTAKTDKYLVLFLAECAKNGEKHGKSFPKPVYTKAADAVSEFCKQLFDLDNLD